MKLNRINTVKIKLTFSILVLTLVIVSFVGIYFPGRFKHEQLIALQDKANTTISIIAANISASIYFNDSDVLKDDLSKMMKYDEVGYVIVKSNNQLLYHYNLNEAQKCNYLLPSSVNNIKDDLYFKVSEKVIIGNNEVGVLYVGFGLSKLYGQLDDIKKNLLVINCLILLFGVVSSFIIGNYFTKPIHQIIKTAEKVKTGNFNTRVNINNKDEMGYLADRFNSMIETLGKFYSVLEEKVSERTKELAETNSKLEYEIDERKNAEIKIKKSLDEKIVMLKEIHHRVKNNLQIISSLLFLQSEDVNDAKTKEYFDESRNRILSMALVHENLYKHEDLSKIDFADYIMELVKNLRTSYSNNLTFEIITQLEKVFFPVDVAIPLGLILNELITNTFKHAFTDNGTAANNENKLWIILKNGDKIIINVIDNGKGLPDDFADKMHTSLGTKIINSLISQINAEFLYEGKNGSKFSIILNKT